MFQGDVNAPGMEGINFFVLAHFIFWLHIVFCSYSVCRFCLQCTAITSSHNEWEFTLCWMRSFSHYDNMPGLN